MTLGLRIRRSKSTPHPRPSTQSEAVMLPIPAERTHAYSRRIREAVAKAERAIKPSNSKKAVVISFCWWSKSPSDAASSA